jgi:hypothetical protein
VDECDISSEKQEQLEARKIAEVRAQANKLEAEPTGSCLWCEEPVAKGHRWCDAQCRDLWQRHK